MAAYYTATLRASPLLFLSFKESINTVISDVFQVINHAHMVKSAVAFVESLQPMAGEILAIVAKSHKPFPQQFTLPSVVTILVARQAAGAVRLPKPLLLQVVLHRQVAGAQAAVHPTGSD